MNNQTNNSKWKILIIVLASIVLALIIPLAYQQMKQPSNHSKSEAPKKNESNEKKGKKIIWEVDSANITTNEMYKCVKENYGEPAIWGRYLGSNGNVSTGLTKKEIKFLHEKKVKILLIYNHFSNATTKKAGVKEAETAIKLAKEINAPKGTVIFADIEPKYPVDSAFIQGWVDTIEKSHYHPGIYGIFDKDAKLYNQFNKASKDNKKIKDQTILWTAAPNKRISSKEKAPNFNPIGPKNSLLYGWQYGIDAKTCNIDTDLFHESITDYLW
ncbi:hypothetical protein B4102_2773 [Heyndrickxia sporothermodurans]|uniref:Rv2525c-like glycoside hydrolase-like domain-containing protein n=1 Tax=Heyndrickxia sporothermodurans TaxID=46224 RepID=A0A150L930_9BACI|nr:glycoside hydrolase domain-containing protein [Heyndrickxia sporothermodurans]KYD08496.1 hypothetical protein B4102_2773 [Heyndrickxia sporothermodurans]